MKRIIFEQVHKRLPYVIPSVKSKIGELTGNNTAAIAVSTYAPQARGESMSRKRLAPTVLPLGSPLAPTCHSLLSSVFLYPFVRVYSFHSPTHLRHCVCPTMPAFSLEERKALPPQLFHQHSLAHNGCTRTTSYTNEQRNGKGYSTPETLSSGLGVDQESIGVGNGAEEAIGREDLDWKSFHVLLNLKSLRPQRPRIPSFPGLLLYLLGIFRSPSVWRKPRGLIALTHHGASHRGIQTESCRGTWEGSDHFLPSWESDSVFSGAKRRLRHM